MEAETSPSSQFDDILDNRDPIVNHSVRLIDILVNSVAIWVLSCAVPVI